MATDTDLEYVEKRILEAYPESNIPIAFREDMKSGPQPNMKDCACRPLCMIMIRDQRAYNTLLTHDSYTSEDLWEHKAVGPYLQAALKVRLFKIWWESRRSKHKLGEPAFSERSKRKILACARDEDDKANNEVEIIACQVGQSYDHRPHQPGRDQSELALDAKGKESMVRSSVNGAITGATPSFASSDGALETVASPSNTLSNSQLLNFDPTHTTKDGDSEKIFSSSSHDEDNGKEYPNQEKYKENEANSSTNCTISKPPDATDGYRLKDLPVVPEEFAETILDRRPSLCACQRPRAARQAQKKRRLTASARLATWIRMDQLLYHQKKDWPDTLQGMVSRLSLSLSVQQSFSA